MPPRKRIEAAVYIVDCSENIKTRLELLYKIFAVKYFAQTDGKEKDVQQVVLYNHPDLKTKHVVNDWSYYALDKLREIEKITEKVEKAKPHNFLFMIKCACELLNHEMVERYVKRIVFITELSKSMTLDDRTDDQIGIIQDYLTDNKIWLYIIGPDVQIPRIKHPNEIETLCTLNLKGNLTIEQKQNYAVLRKLLKRNVVVVDAENGLHVLFAHVVEPKPPFPWYVRLNIGRDIFIPVCVTKSIRPYATIKLEACPSDKAKKIHLDKRYYDVNTHDIMPREDVVHGYKFQGKLVTLSAEQVKDKLKTQTKKCLTIFGFAKAEDVHLNVYLMPNSLNTVRVDTRCKGQTEHEFNLFAASLRNKNMVALAYRVYNNNNNKKFFGIFPCPDHANNNHLLMGELPYRHEFRERFIRGTLVKPELETAEKGSLLVEDLLEAMTISDEIQPLFESVKLNESRVRRAEVLAYKNMNKDPGEPPELQPNPCLVSRAENIAAQLQQYLQS